MKKKQTYIIGGETVKQPPKKKIQIDIQAPKPKKKPAQKSKKPFTRNMSELTANSTISGFIRPIKGGRQAFFDKGFAGEGAITLEPNGSLSYYFGTKGGYGTPYQGFNSGTKIKYGELTHVAVVRDFTNKKLVWYINGNRTNQGKPRFNRAAKTSWPLKIAKGYTGQIYQGQI